MHIENVVLQRLTSFTGGHPVIRGPSLGDVRLIEGFISHLALERRLSPHTTAAYRTDLLGLATFLARAGSGLEEVDYRILRRWLAYLSTRGYARPSSARQAASVRATCRFLARGALADEGPAAR